MMQLVVSGNRVLAHGNDCFIPMGGTVICNDTGRVFQNATIVYCDHCPSDIDEVGYEYHAGRFVPCAPYGKGIGNLAIVCDDCKTVKDSNLHLHNVQTQHKTATAVLTAAGWSSLTQTVAVEGVTENNTVIIAAAPDSQDNYTKFKVKCTAQAAGKLTFTCSKKPTGNLTVNIMIWGVWA